MIAKIVPALNTSLHGRFFVEFGTLCLVLLNSLTTVICKFKAVECFNRTKLCSLCP